VHDIDRSDLQWCVMTLRDRAPAAGGPVFAAPLGGWRDPSNTQADLRDACVTGFDSVTFHVFRKTVTPLMDQAGLPSRAQPISSCTPTPR
jgi:hypothetical protein